MSDANSLPSHPIPVEHLVQERTKTRESTPILWLFRGAIVALVAGIFLKPLPKDLDTPSIPTVLTQVQLEERENLAREVAERSVEYYLLQHGDVATEDIQRWCNIDAKPIQMEWAKQCIHENRLPISIRAIALTMQDFHLRGSDPNTLVTDFIPRVAQFAVDQAVAEEVRVSLRRNIPPARN